MATYKFFRKDLNTWIEAPKEVWCWEAHYHDGQVVKQFDDQGVFHQFSEIDQDRLALFKMVSLHHPQTYTLTFSDPAMKLIHFYRNTILNAGTPEEQRTRLYCFGWEKKIGIKTHKVLLMLTPSNNLIVSPDELV